MSRSSRCTRSSSSPRLLYRVKCSTNPRLGHNCREIRVLKASNYKFELMNHIYFNQITRTILSLQINVQATVQNLSHHIHALHACAFTDSFVLPIHGLWILEESTLGKEQSEDMQFDCTYRRRSPSSRWLVPRELREILSPWLMPPHVQPRQEDR